MNNQIINDKLNALNKSKFRSSFHLTKDMIEYIQNKGMQVIVKHAYDFVKQKLVILLDNDGKQTPMKGHPVFIAMHACGCCCRGCIEKWHHISKDKILTDNEVNYIVSILIEWIRRNYKQRKDKHESHNNKTTLC